MNVGTGVIVGVGVDIAGAEQDVKQRMTSRNSLASFIVYSPWPKTSNFTLSTWITR